MGKYIRINAGDLTVRVIEGDGANPSLSLMQSAVGGWIEHVFSRRLPCSVSMFCNEEGKLLGMLENMLATDLLGYGGDVIAGDVIIVGNDAEGNSRWLTESEISKIRECCDGVKV